MNYLFKNPLPSKLFITVGSKGFKPVFCLLIMPCVKDKEGNMECLDTMKDIEDALKATGQGEEVMDELAKLFYELLRED
jgi:hypothetical protein